MNERLDAIPHDVRGERISEALDRLIELYQVTNRPDEASKHEGLRTKGIEASSPAGDLKN